MALGSVNSRNAVLNASLSGTDAPATLYLALYTSSSYSTEITDGGYQRAPVPKTSWAAASGGFKVNNVDIAFQPSTGVGWTGIATYAALMSTPSGAGDRWDSGALGASVTVPAAGTVVTFPAGSLSVSEE